ncbi:hypothetical protein BT96DRAFT_988052 [Gymnopus androsaceus JB14]|uniref:Uncharacterized protein n=1 Tax=Gymnopus androsaceus JB14 TaxID=1447944 RepID=A0A6A4I517_9AGAR|nr:hypothetical protein BT96DRAFT_988052 [Gymnopus androsaceus JB14]
MPVAAKGREDVKAQKELLKEYFQDAGSEPECIIRKIIAANDFYYNVVGQVRKDKWSKARVSLCFNPLRHGHRPWLIIWHGTLERCPNDHTAAFAEYET